MSGQVRGICWSRASPYPPCNGTPPASVWPLPRQTPGPSCLYPSDRTDASMQNVVAPSIWFSPSDLYKKNLMSQQDVTIWKTPINLEIVSPRHWLPNCFFYCIILSLNISFHHYLHGLFSCHVVLKKYGQLLYHFQSHNV